MPCYMMLSKDIKGTFTSAVTKQKIIDSLKTNAIKNPSRAQFQNAGLIPVIGPDNTTTVLPAGSTFLLGADKTDSLKFPTPLFDYFGGEDAIFRAPTPDKGDWLACVKLYNHDNPTIATFMVVALVGGSTLKAANIGWTKEDPPPQIWKTHMKTKLGRSKETADVFCAFDTSSWK